MGAPSSSKTQVTNNQSIWHHIQENFNL